MSERRIDVAQRRFMTKDMMNEFSDSHNHAIFQNLYHGDKPIS